MLIQVVGVDSAFSNMGLARASIDLRTGSILINSLRLISTEAQAKKVVRKSSDDLRRARELHGALSEFAPGSLVAFAEVPHGSQSGRASWALGIAVGVLASCPIPMIQVNAL